MTNRSILRIHGEEEAKIQTKGKEILFNEIVTENICNLRNDIDIQL
jgi:hypothetical protein